MPTLQEILQPRRDIERRAVGRTTINRDVLMFFTGQDRIHPCCVRDVTNLGACLRLNGLNIVPSEFGISFDSSARRVGVAWSGAMVILSARHSKAKSPRGTGNLDRLGYPSATSGRGQRFFRQRSCCCRNQSGDQRERATRKVCKVISGGQFRRTGSRLVPAPAEV